MFDAERHELLQQIERWLDTPMLVLGFVWLGLVIGELLWNLSPLLETTVTVIWVIFILNFAVEFILAPRRFTYLKRNWLTAIALVVPALRMRRVARALRAFRIEPPDIRTLCPVTTPAWYSKRSEESDFFVT